MGRASTPATVVLLSGRSAGNRRADPGHDRSTVSWVVAPDRIGDVPEHAAAVVALTPACLDSRQSLRAVIHEARRRRPALASVLVREAPLRHHGVLAEAGIRVVLVDTFSAMNRRGPRRPAPPGWACRSVVWGLWEVALTPPTRGWRRLLRGTALPTIRPGSLAVVLADDGPGNEGDARSLDACAAWAMRARSSTDAMLTSVDDLPALLERGGAHGEGFEQRGSILRAA